MLQEKSFLSPESCYNEGRKEYHPNSPSLTIKDLKVASKFCDILDLFREDERVKGYTNRDDLCDPKV